MLADHTDEQIAKVLPLYTSSKLLELRAVMGRTLANPDNLSKLTEGLKLKGSKTIKSVEDTTSLIQRTLLILDAELTKRGVA